MSAEATESELLAAAVRGDDEALSKLLVREHDHLLRRIGVRIPVALCGTISAEDVLQETFIIAFRRVQSFQPVADATFADWLMGIACNVLRDKQRAQQAAKRGGGRLALDAVGEDDDELINLLELLSGDTRTPSRSAARHEAAQAVRAALDGLAGDCRQALQLRYVEALPVAEIASRIGRTEGATHQLCHRGLAALRTALGASGRFLSRKA
jgi:RNA polymerase sigma-70 factor (ECF subfamily)